ncbi:carbohydrate ABC transporter permease [Amycolatopsis pigmentata]|uniref:Carbohydrate ABC transporter permease n=1 Tax=Amycolatopsis pigmentata TaxID=450801 RepID=A0ABW5FNV3_9PSEU
MTLAMHGQPAESAPQPPTSFPARPPNQAKARSRRKAWVRRLPLLPALLFVAVTTQVPFGVTLVVSLLTWNALYPERRGFAGLRNFRKVFESDELRTSLLTTIVLTVIVVVVSLVLGLILALLLDRRFRGRAAVRTMLIAPYLVVPVAAALLWKHALLNPAYGLVNGIIKWTWGLFGSSAAPQPAWIADHPLASVEASLVWQWTPFMALILLAGLQSKPLDALEAARIDGAGHWQTFRYIILPHLRRYLELGALLGSIYIVQNFDAVYTMTAGGLGTANLPYSIYQAFFQTQDYGLTSAMGVLVVIGTMIIATFALRVVSSLFKEEISR